jgi:hypothetical protein
MVDGPSLFSPDRFPEASDDFPLLYSFPRYTLEIQLTLLQFLEDPEDSGIVDRETFVSSFFLQMSSEQSSAIAEIPSGAKGSLRLRVSDFKHC